MAVSRLRLYDLMESELPELVGVCRGNWSDLANIVNRAQLRLLTCREAGETGWWGGFAEMAFNVSQLSPFITLPRGVARLISLNACEYPIEVQNQFYEYLQFGSGNWPKTLCGASTTVCVDDYVRAFRRNTVCTFSDLVPTGKFLRIRPTDPADAALRTLVGCRDANGLTVRQMDGPVQVEGLYANLIGPWQDLSYPGVSTPLEISAITNIQKDLTTGAVTYWEVDMVTGVERLLLRMEPSETVAAYERYYLHDLPKGCCCAPGATSSTTVQTKAMVKLDLIPARVDSDYLLIQHKEAIICEAQSVRFGDTDNPALKASAAERHREAIKYLQGQLIHYEGKEHPAISFAPFGHARLINQRIGYMQ